MASPHTSDASGRVYPMAPLIRSTLVALYLALVLPLPLLAPDPLRPLMAAAVPLGLLLILALVSEQVEIDAIGIKAHGMGHTGRRAEGPIGRGGMPETIMRWHHRHPDTHRDLIPCHQRRQHAAARKPTRFGQGKRGWHHHGTDMQQGALMRVIIIGGIDQNAIGECRESRLHRSTLGAHDMCAGCSGIKCRDIARDAGFFCIFCPGRHGAAKRIQHQPRRLAPHVWRQCIGLDGGCKFRKGARGHGGDSF